MQLHLGALLQRKLKKGETLTECSIQTSEGVKVADVAWCSKAFIKQYGYQTPYPKAPELCMEVVSPSNSKQEMHEKVHLYLQAGAEEVWIVWENGLIDYYAKTGQLTASNFGVIVKLPSQ